MMHSSLFACYFYHNLVKIVLYMTQAVVWFAEFSHLGNCYLVQRRLKLILYQNICCLVDGVLLCYCCQVHDWSYMCIDNNSNRTWHVLLCVYSLQIHKALNHHSTIYIQTKTLYWIDLLKELYQSMYVYIILNGKESSHWLC